MRKKFLMVVCALSITFTLVACGNNGNVEDTLTPSTTPTETPTSTPHEHSYTSEVTKEATCESDGQGELTYTCSICGDTYTEETDRIDHCTDDIKVIQEATCSQVGIKTYSCIFCGREFKREELPKLPHTESDWIVVTEAIGSENGLKHKVCTVCGEETASEVIYNEVVASGVLAEGRIEWKIVGTTLYISGKGSIPDFQYSAVQSRRFPDVLPWDGLVGWQIYDELVEKIVIEEGITKVGRSNFDCFKKVKEITFPDSLTEVGSYACTDLAIEEIDFKNITTLGTQAFGRLPNLKSLTVPGQIKTISRYCFVDFINPYLTEIYIEEGVEVIEQGAFECLGSIDCKIHLPSSLKSMADSSLTNGMTVYVKAGSYAEQAANEYKDNSALTIIVD